MEGQIIWNSLIDKVSKSLDGVSYNTFLNFTAQILRHENIFITGAGRSGLVGKFFAMRLMHLGKNAYIAGETITPKIIAGDLLVAISASGNTATVVNAANVARTNGAKIISVISAQNSRLSELSDGVIRIKSPVNKKTCKHYHAEQLDNKNTLNIMPMGTLFELSALLILESVIAEIIRECCILEEDMKQRHANLQ